MYHLSGVVEAHTRTLVDLNETHERSAGSLRIIMLMMSGVLAFSVLDRITGQWSVMGSTWFTDFSKPMIQDSPVSARSRGRGRQPAAR